MTTDVDVDAGRSWWARLFTRTGRSRIARIPVKGSLGDQDIDTYVDSDIARIYLEHYLTNDGASFAHRSAIDKVHLGTDEAITREYLKRLADEYSPDFATLFLAHRMQADPANAALRSRFRRELAALRDRELDRRSVDASAGAYLVVFVPGFNYRSRPNTGADFATPRAMLDRVGIRHRLLEIRENGSVEANAALIAEALAGLSGPESVIVVSASKAGAETALALGGANGARASRHVRAWINICGMLQGTPRADIVLRSPVRRRFFKAYFWLKGWDFASVESLATGPSRARLRGLTLPAHVSVVNFVGFPLSGDLTELARPEYEKLRAFGPNDGLTLLIDGIFPTGSTIVEMGLDHYFRDADIELKTVALVQTVVGICVDRMAM